VVKLNNDIRNPVKICDYDFEAISEQDYNCWIKFKVSEIYLKVLTGRAVGSSIKEGITKLDEFEGDMDSLKMYLDTIVFSSQLGDQMEKIRVNLGFPIKFISWTINKPPKFKRLDKDYWEMKFLVEGQYVETD
jgi:hypothetical protein